MFICKCPELGLLHECSYPCNARTSVPIPTVFLILLFTEVTVTVTVTLLLLLLCYYCCYITVATDNLCQGSLLSGAAELTIHLLRLINILWLPLYRINKFGLYFPRRLLRSPILVGHQDYFLAPLPGSIALFGSSLVIYTAR